MTTFDIVPAFNVFEDRCPGFNSGSISVKIDLFCFVDEIKLISWTQMAQYGMFSVLNEGAGVYTTC
jgi:hypothetical protein